MNLKNKKIMVLGLSIEGRETVKYLLSQNLKVVACDQKETLPKELLQELKNPNLTLLLGKNYLDHITDYEVIFRSPGIPLWYPLIIEAKNKGAIITSLTKLFFDLCLCPIIGVTGTKGKGTTVSLIGEILKKGNKNVFVGGNIGMPLINELPQMNKNSIVVLELSSFQLEDLEKSPRIAVILNITSDHLASTSTENPNYHKSQEDYLQAKKNLVLYQNKDDYAVINYDYSACRDLEKNTKADVWHFSKTHEIAKGAYVHEGKIYLRQDNAVYFICETKDLLLKGEHNLENVTAAITASYLGGASLESIQKGVLSFKGLEHRLELVAKVMGVNYYNDSFSTTPETAIAAIRAFPEPKIIILGGSDKGSDYTELGREIAHSNIKAIILIGLMTEKIEQAIMSAGGTKAKIIKGLRNMKDIVETCTKESQPGDVVLLSPACASFDMFNNYKDRGEQFKHEVEKIRQS